MKPFLPLICLAAALSVVSCHSLRRPHPDTPVPPAPVVTVPEVAPVAEVPPTSADKPTATAPAAAQPAAEEQVKEDKPGFFGRMFGSRKKSEPEQPAPPAAEEPAKEDKPGFFSRLFGSKSSADEQAPPTEPKVTPQTAAVTPTPQQQQAAMQVLQTEENPEPAAEEPTEPAVPELSTGGLRLRRFAPPEEAISSAEGSSEALPNSAELHGLRSPGLRGGTLPMDINGKMTKPTEDTEAQDDTANKEN